VASLIPDLSISSVITTAQCPIWFYLEKNSKKKESWRYAVAKQISYHLGSCLDEDEIWDEVCLIQKDMEDSRKDFLTESVRICRNNPTWRNYRESDLKVQSTRYRVHGVIDKLFDDEPSFSITRPTLAPSKGIYTADRIRITGYCICLEEMCGKPVESGSIEYIPSGIERVCMVQPIDKRRFLRALFEARRIQQGEIPRKPLNPPCRYCPHNDCCELEGGTRLSDLI
jgi:CRISPR-associated exonuclease Cas4